MLNTRTFDIPASFKEFLNQSDSEYRQRVSTIPLFDNIKTSSWTQKQKKLFAAIFYHIRGHFIDFMWYIANFAHDEQTKKIIMENIYEEIGTGNKFSHEFLYERFANECGVNIHDEIINQTHYLPFAREFNREHLHWLTKNDADGQLSAFSAYERLDNIDYIHLASMAESLGLSSKGMAFFNVHVHVEHFEASLERLLPIWESSQDKLQRSFNFIYSHQQQMWQKLSDTIFAQA